MENIIVVGNGDVFHRFIAPSLELLEHEGRAKTLCTIDIRQRADLEYLSEKIEHRIRTPDEKLSDLLEDKKNESPIVILSHDTDMHYSDSKELLNSGFRVMLEKPYVSSAQQFKDFEKLVSENSGRIFLMEYYLMRKMSPLFVLSGLIDKNSFYMNPNEVFREKNSDKKINSYLGVLQEILGDPVSLKIKIIESQGDSGKVDHRGAHVFDKRRGGGMIQDMGIHALIPIFSLENYIGNLTLSNENSHPKIASSKDFYKIAKDKYNLSENFIAETYAEMNFITDRNIPIQVSVGKYVADNRTQKNLIFQGEKGKIDLNMHENHLNIYEGKKVIGRIDLVNLKRSRYYPVLRSGIEFFSNNNPLLHNPYSIQMQSQKLVLDTLSKLNPEKIILYDNGEKPENIFI